MTDGSTATGLPALPSLSPFLHHLAALISSPSCPSFLFIHNPKRSPVLLDALTTILTTHTRAPAPSDPPTVEQLLPKAAFVDLKDVHSVKAAFDRILDRLSGWDAEGAERWGDRNGGIEAWDGSMEGLKVVRREKKRKAVQGGAGRRAKRASRDDDDAYGEEDEEEEVEDAAADENGEQPEWVLQWDRSAASSSTKPSLAPLRNTVDAFHHSLTTIFAASAPSSSPSFSSAASSLDPAADLRRPPPNQPARRFIVLKHGELLSELAGAGTASAAAKETGVGLTFASTMHRLGQLTGLPITVITISRLHWRKARESMVGLPSPELLTFEDIGGPDTVTLLTSRFASSPLSTPSSSDTLSLSRDELIELFKSLATVVQSTFAKSTTDLDEYAYLCAKFWPRWKEVVERSNPPIAPTDTARLSIALKTDFSAELDRLALPRQSLSVVSSSSSLLTASSSATPAAPTQLHGFAGTIAALPNQPRYLADVPPTPDKNGSGSSSFFAAASSSAVPTPTRSTDPSDPFGPATPLRHQAAASSSSCSVPNGGGSGSLLFTSSTATAHKKSLQTHAALAKSLPVVARYLLLAAYFAGVNPPKSDVRMFVKVDETEGVAKRGKKARKQRVAKPGASPSKNSKPATLYGGKSFPYERMIAIFEAIVDDRREYALGSVAVAGQVQTLLHLRLLTRASSESNPDKVLDGVKLKCPLAKDVVEALALSVGWKEWRERVVGEE
ncbi:hypothetical protein JCM8097_009338 [Rhodosporidiobolus ruineniae]